MFTRQLSIRQYVKSISSMHRWEDSLAMALKLMTCD